MPFNHCPHCGAAFPPVDAQGTSPAEQSLIALPLGSPHQTCAECGAISHHNPLPVAVNMIPCLDEHLGDPDRRRWLMGQRNIMPKIGEFAMLSGFVELGERIEVAGAREGAEEANLVLPSEGMQVLGSLHVPRGNHLLVFCAWPAMPESVIEGFEPNVETQALAWRTRHEPIAFPLHADALARWGDLAVTLLNR